MVGEGVVRLRNRKQDKNYERENYIDFRMRLLGEPGKLQRHAIGPERFPIKTFRFVGFDEFSINCLNILLIMVIPFVKNALKGETICRKIMSNVTCYRSSFLMIFFSQFYRPATFTTFAWYSQFSIQIRIATRFTIDIFWKKWLGSVFLQSSSQRTQWSYS